MPTSKRSGSRMEIRSWEAFNSMFEQSHPFLSLFEVLKNSWQAWDSSCGGTSPQIDIFPDANGNVVVVDNGIGVAANMLRKRIGAFGDTSKKAGATEGENLGWGASITLSFQNRENGALFTSWTKAQTKAAQVLISLDHDGAPALLEHGRPSKDVQETKKPVNTPSGTQVVFQDIEFDPDLIEFEVSARFPAFFSNGSKVEAEIRIHDSNPFSKGYSARPRPLRGVWARAASLESQSIQEDLGIPTRGHFETPHAIVDWFILESPPAQLAHCYETWNGEVYDAYSGSGFVSTMSAYGVWAGHDRIVLMINKRNPTNEPAVITDLLRNSTKNWDRSQAQKEVRAVICVPGHPLFQFMDWFSSNEEEKKPDDHAIQKILEAWQADNSKLFSNANGDPSNKGTSDDENENENEKKKDEQEDEDGKEKSEDEDEKKKKRTRRRRRRKSSTEDDTAEDKITAPPRAMMVRRGAIGNDPVRYIPDRNVIQINREIGIVAELIEEARITPNRAQKRTIDLIKAHMVLAVIKFNDVTGRLPGQEGDEFSLIMAINCPTAALNYVRGSTPKKTTKTRKKKTANKKSS